MKTVIVGGVAGGASAAARLRRLDELATIVLLERGPFISFANCGLPYYIGGEISDKTDLLLQTPESFHARFGVDVRIWSRVVFIDRKNKTVSVLNELTKQTTVESYDKLILSTGAEPLVPPFPGTDLPGVFTLRTIPDTLAIKEYIEHHQAKSVVVAGGGFIGMEMAENFKMAGLEVTIVELADHLIAPLDREMSADVFNYAKSQGISVLLNNGITDITKVAGGLRIGLNHGFVEADMLLLSIGVRPESTLAKEAGLVCNARGAVVVNEWMKTSDSDIYAVGDSIEITNFVSHQKAYLPLAGPANKQGRIAADNICNLDSRYEGTQGSAILKFFDMTVAVTGLNEQTAKAANLNADKVYLYPGSHAGYYPGSTEIAMKVVFERRSGKILGAQLIGSNGVDKRCDVIATAIRLGATVRDLTKLELCYAPPYGSAKDPVNMAGFLMENVMTGKMKQAFWEEVKLLPRNNSLTLLDVRTEEEFAKGAVNGFTNIPLHQLRQKLTLLDREKPVYVHCQSGLRSYIAYRILANNKFDVYNIAGGYRLYQSVALAQVAMDNQSV